MSDWRISQRYHVGEERIEQIVCACRSVNSSFLQGNTKQFSERSDGSFAVTCGELCNPREGI